MAARREGNPRTYLSGCSVHIEFSQQEMDQLRRQSALHRLPVTRIIRAKLRVPSDVALVRTVYDQETADAVDWYLHGPELPVRRGRRA